MWPRIKSWCLHSAVVTWSYLLFAASEILINLDSIAEVLGTPEVHDQVLAVTGPYSGQVLRLIALITFAARMRGKLAKAG